MTNAKEHNVPLPNKMPNWAIKPCVENFPNKNPTIVNTLPEVKIDTIQDETEEIIACNFPEFLRFSK